MAHTLLDTGVLKVSVRYLLPKNGTYFYQRRIPDELRGHYGGRALFRKSLKTKDLAVAARKVAALAAEHDRLWSYLRAPEAAEEGRTTEAVRQAARDVMAENSQPLGAGRPEVQARYDYLATEEFFKGLLKREAQRVAPKGVKVSDDDIDDVEMAERLSEDLPLVKEVERLLYEDPKKPRVLLSDALARYLTDKGLEPDSKPARDATRAIQQVITTAGDLPLSAYERQNAYDVRDALRGSGNATGTVRRRLRSINAVFNFGLREFNLRAHGNPFERLEIPKEGHDADTREPFTAGELKTIAIDCLKRDDDMRHIVGLQLDTGARLAEVVGLRLADLHLDAEVPHVHFRPDLKHGRSLKTSNSDRKVPLVGMALWGAHRAVAEASKRDNGGWLFPRYASGTTIKAAGASASLNKWLGVVLKPKQAGGAKQGEAEGADKTTHSFRHAMRDRLRHAGVPQDVQDVIGGWGSRTQGQSYGSGYQLGQLRECLEKVAVEPVTLKG